MKSKDFKASQRQTIAIQFRQQLATLMHSLSSTTLHYIRCIKPNALRKSFEFDKDLVLTQLKYTGMLETIKIRKSGFAKRFLFNAFNDR